MVKRFLALLLALAFAVPAGLVAARRACGEKGRRIDVQKDYTTAPGGWKPLDLEGGAFALDEGPGLRVP